MQVSSRRTTSKGKARENEEGAHVAFGQNLLPITKDGGFSANQIAGLRPGTVSVSFLALCPAAHPIRKKCSNWDRHIHAQTRGQEAVTNYARLCLSCSCQIVRWTKEQVMPATNKLFIGHSVQPRWLLIC